MSKKSFEMSNKVAEISKILSEVSKKRCRPHTVTNTGLIQLPTMEEIPQLANDLTAMAEELKGAISKFSLTEHPLIAHVRKALKRSFDRCK